MNVLVIGATGRVGRELVPQLLDRHAHVAIVTRHPTSPNLPAQTTVIQGVNAVAHVTFPFVAHSWYFSGLITVILPTIAGAITLLRLLESDRKARGSAPPVKVPPCA